MRLGQYRTPGVRIQGKGREMTGFRLNRSGMLRRPVGAACVEVRFSRVANANDVVTVAEQAQTLFLFEGGTVAQVDDHAVAADVDFGPVEDGEIVEAERGEQVTRFGQCDAGASRDLGKVA